MSRAPAGERLARLLTIVPWVASRDGPPVTEVCARFGVAEDELLADLDLLFLCGVHPFTPDSLIEVDVAGGRVWIRFADYFRRPLRPSAPEGLALLSAGSALLTVPGADPDGALGRAVANLRAVLGVGEDGGIDVALAPVDEPTLLALRAAESQRRKVELEYYSFGRDTTTTRVVHPWRVFNAEGEWYLTGWCERADGERLFRVDRILAARVLEERFRPPARPSSTALFHPDPAAPTIVVDLQPAVHWIAERYPNEGVERRAGGVLRVRLRVGERAWLERLLLRAGPAATVVEGDGSPGPQAAARILARYRP